MAGLRVGQAFGVLLLLGLGFGVSSSSPQVPGHPTSTCDKDVNEGLMQFSSKKCKLVIRSKDGSFGSQQTCNNL